MWERPRDENSCRPILYPRLVVTAIPLASPFGDAACTPGFRAGASYHRPSGRSSPAVLMASRLKRSANCKTYQLNFELGLLIPRTHRVFQSEVDYSTVTDLARLRGLSTSLPRFRAV